MVDQAKHNVFLSWSGDLSKRIALAVHDWLPTVIQAADPFMSEQDIEPGSRGQSKIALELEGIGFGIICVTPDNQESRWLNYEAGAISKKVLESRVVPLLFNLEKSQLKLPLGQFQAKNFIPEDMNAIARNVNIALGQPLTDAKLERAFEMAWPAFNGQIERIGTESSQSRLVPDPPKRTPEDMLEELIVGMREQSAAIAGLPANLSKPRSVDDHLSIASSVLQTLAKRHGVETMNATELANMGASISYKDWKLIDTSPFLRWYLEHYFAVVRPTDEELQLLEMDDVPF